MRRIRNNTITIENLETWGVCGRALKWFRRVFPSGRARITLTNLRRLARREEFWLGELAEFVLSWNKTCSFYDFSVEEWQRPRCRERCVQKFWKLWRSQ